MNPKLGEIPLTGFWDTVFTRLLGHTDSLADGHTQKQNASGNEGFWFTAVIQWSANSPFIKTIYHVWGMLPQCFCNLDACPDDEPRPRKRSRAYHHCRYCHGSSTNTFLRKLQNYEEKIAVECVHSADWRVKQHPSHWNAPRLHALATGTTSWTNAHCLIVWKDRK